MALTLSGSVVAPLVMTMNPEVYALNIAKFAYLFLKDVINGSFKDAGGVLKAERQSLDVFSRSRSASVM